MADNDIAAPPSSSSSADPSTTTATDKETKLAAQVKKLTEANAKYKNLLKLAKDRIQQEEENRQQLQEEKDALEERLASEEKEAAGNIVLDEANDRGDVEINIVRVLLRVKVRQGDFNEIWALMELETVSNEMADIVQPPRRTREWKRFDTESELQDYIRRDTGEPLILPPYSLSPEQSATVEEESAEQIAKVTEEFRRFRVRAELARKQADAQIRELQSNHAQSSAWRIEGQELHQELERARLANGELEQMKAELATQESHWKEAYDLLLAENHALRSAGSEAMLASQWRKRYEACLKEKEELQSRLNNASKNDEESEGKYEAKYRDLKESFRLYRKKAKEIFEEQQREGAAPGTFSFGGAASADAKLSYLKNLMFNYLTAEATIRDHMEGAIGTVLQFTPEERALVEKKKAESESWFESMGKGIKIG